MSEGLRFNEGKTRHDLVPAFAQEQYAKVLTLGAQKYAERNWEKGMAWSKVMASLMRHTQAIMRGEDYDKESGLLHSAHVMCNAAFLTEYYKIYPQGDDRPHHYYSQFRIGTDIDDVLCDFIGAYCERYGLEKPKFWDFDPMFWERYQELADDEQFWLSLKTITTPQDLLFQPVVYITSRPESLRNFTERWLFEVNKYPVAPVVFTSDKLTACREHKVDRFIDDKYATFVNLNKNKVLCYLFDACHNEYVDVGFRRVNRDTLTKVL